MSLTCLCWLVISEMRVSLREMAAVLLGFPSCSEQRRSQRCCLIIVLTATCFAGSKRPRSLGPPAITDHGVDLYAIISTMFGTIHASRKVELLFSCQWHGLQCAYIAALTRESDTIALPTPPYMQSHATVLTRLTLLTWENQNLALSTNFVHSRYLSCSHVSSGYLMRSVTIEFWCRSQMF